ncbi:MAG: type II toxin-antitoxin system VapB family antitoxin [Planctomycetaceae bacterium]|nr:type II toxin-antitoxin system VapB family antitoxin [Planctomycetaceae bacterium]
MRTNIVIDDEVMQTAMEVSGIRTKKGVVEQALREFVARRTRKDIRDLRGKIRFADGYDYKALRKGR